MPITQNSVKTDAHAIREEQVDLSFADFEVRDGSERFDPAPTSAEESQPEEDQ